MVVRFNVTPVVPLAIPLVLLSAVPQPIKAQGQARVLRTDDPLSGRSDVRLIIQSLDWPAASAPTDHPDVYKGATLIIACGDRFPSDSGRALLLYAGEPMVLMGGEEIALELRFNGDRGPHRHWAVVADPGDMAVRQTGSPSLRHLGFLGEENRPYFSPSLLSQMLKADTLEVVIPTYGGNGKHRVRFLLAALRDHLKEVAACNWPTGLGGGQHLD